jgi:hypothetical protein
MDSNILVIFLSILVLFIWGLFIYLIISLLRALIRFLNRH